MASFSFTNPVSLSSDRAGCLRSPFTIALLGTKYLMKKSSRSTTHLWLSSERARCRCPPFSPTVRGTM